MKLRVPSLLAPALVLPVLASCVATTPTVAPLELSKDTRLVAVPLIRQEEAYGCGLSSLGALCGYWQTSIDPAEQERLKQSAFAEQGLSGAEMREELEQLGFDTFLFRGALDHSPTGLLTHLDAKRPPLVMLALQPPRHHYVIVVGYDEPTQRVCVLDPVRGNVALSRSKFEQAWEGCGNFTLLAVPRSKTVVALGGI